MRTPALLAVASLLSVTLLGAAPRPARGDGPKAGIEEPAENVGLAVRALVLWARRRGGA